MPDSGNVVVVGAGPAGLAAARRFVAAGLRPVVVEETDRPGGQGTRRLAPQMASESARIFGRSASAIAEREEREDAVMARCDFRTNTLVWGCYDSRLELIGPSGFETLPYSRLLLSIGATDRVMPLPGWTLPGVFSLGGAQVALKRHASFIGRRIVFAGSSPLLYLAAVQYLRLGHRNLTILDTTHFRDKLRAFPAMLRYAPTTTLQGVSLMAELWRAGLPVHTGVKLEKIEGNTQVEAIRYVRPDGRIQRIEADAIALGYGLRPETQLAELAGASFEFDNRHRQWFPKVDMMGRANETLWLAGDGARTGGAIAADASGALAAEDILRSLGHASGDELEISSLKRHVRSQRRFQHAITRAFRWPVQDVENLPDDMILCRCERVRLGEVRAAVTTTLGPSEINRVKSITRCGMGRCQGRFCEPALAEVVALVSGGDVGRLRAQAPVRPIPLVHDAEPKA